jgi:predicted nucleotidyltransferase
MVDETIVKSVRTYLRVVAEHGIPVSFGVVFGSFTTGRAHQWSDIDLIVVSPHFDGPYTRDDIHVLWHVTVRTDNRIEPIACGEKQWEQDDASAIIEIARREGQRIDIEEQPVGAKE